MAEGSAREHRRAGESVVARCAIITLSDTRNLETDASGKLIEELLVGAKHVVVWRRVIRDEPAELEVLFREAVESGDVDAVLTTGGTGISRRDQTISVVERNLTQVLPGFGEL